MKKVKSIKVIALFLASLIVMLPVSFAQSLSLTYDNNGNLVTGDGFYRMYDSENKLWKVFNGSSASGVLLEEYTYDLIEERALMKKSYNLSGNWTETVVYINKNFVRVKNASGSFDFTYVYQDGQLVAQRNPDGTKLFYHPDNKGSTTLITDQSGNLVEQSFYAPYGRIISGGSSRYDYEAKEYDSLTQSYDFHFRKAGIAGTPPYQQPDTLLPNVYDPQQLNRYSFERNNPYKYIDSSGHCIEDLCIVEMTIVLSIYVLGGFSMAVANAQVEEAEKTGYPEAINKAKFNFYTTPFTSSLGILFPQSKVVEYFGIYSTGKDVFDAWNLIHPPQASTPTFTQTRNSIISSAIAGYEDGKHSSGSSSGANNNNNNDKLGVGSLIQRWLQNNPEKKEDLKKTLSDGRNSGSSGKIIPKNEVKNPENKKWTKG